MLGKILPVAILLFGLAGGVGAGLALRPAPDGSAEEAQAAVGHGSATADPEATGDGHDGATPAEDGAPLHEYVKLNNQFVVPVVEKGRVAALVVLSLSLEVTPGLTERVYELEPKLRDAMLQVLFDHANSGGFSGSFTDGANLVLLRDALHEAASGVIGPEVSDVLIVDIVRQDN